MGYNTTPEYETAQSRISALLAEIGGELQAIATIPNGLVDVDNVIVEDKSNFIVKQCELISAYRDRDAHDDRDSYIAKLEEELTMAKNQAKEERERWYKEFQINQQLKAALKSITAVLTED